MKGFIGLDLLGRLFVILDTGTAFVFAIQHINSLLEKICLKGKNLLPMGSTFFSFQVDHLKGKKVFRFRVNQLKGN